MLLVLLKWFFIALCTSPIWGAFLLHFWQWSVKPRLVPQAEITALAEKLIAERGADCLRQAMIEEDYAWRRSDVFQQAIWRRVRRELSRR